MKLLKLATGKTLKIQNPSRSLAIASARAKIQNGMGFTIIESLMAIVVIGALMTAIAPVIALSVATRVQARRVELATQTVRAYIDGVSAGAIAAPSHTVELNEVDNNNFTSQRTTFAGEAPPSTAGGLSCLKTMPDYPYCSNTLTSSLYCFDLDNDGGCSSNSFKDLVVQAFRSATPSSTEPARDYLLGVRVYRADAFNDSNSLKTTKDTGSRQATFTGGLGDRKAPLVEMTTEIVTDKATLRDFCDRLGGCREEAGGQGSRGAGEQ